jgi:hypothetical protein
MNSLIDKVFSHEDFPTKPSVNGKFFIDKSQAYVVGSEVRADFVGEVNKKKMYYYFYFDHKEHLIVGTRFHEAS